MALTLSSFEGSSKYFWEVYLPPSGTQDGTLYRFKYIGNDYIAVIWSEHDRHIDIEASFKSQYLNYVIVIYPMKEVKKCRVQVIVNFRDQENQYKIEQGIGPLFDGALVDRDILPHLVRRTIINAGRSITVEQNRPRFYRDRGRALSKLSGYARELTYEEVGCDLLAPGLVPFHEIGDYRTVHGHPEPKPPQRTGSYSHHQRMRPRVTQGRQSTGYSSQEESDRARGVDGRKKGRTKHSDSDNPYSRK